MAVATASAAIVAGAVLPACKRGDNPASAPAKSEAKLEDPTEGLRRLVWLRLPDSKNGCPDAFDYFPEGGMRNLWCHLTTFLGLANIERLSGPLWTSGPHSLAKGLQLNDEHSFGHYDPKFVQWLVDHAIPDDRDADFKNKTRVIYDKHFKDLARLYLVALTHIEEKPEFLEGELRYLEAYLARPSVASDGNAMRRPVDRVIPPDALDFDNRYPAAVAFWVRRNADKTAPIFAEGLRRLVRVYDPAAPEWAAAAFKNALAHGSNGAGAGSTADALAGSALGGSGHDAEGMLGAQVGSAAATKIPDGAIDTMIGVAWQRLVDAPFSCPNGFEYKPGGMSVTYCYLKGLLDLSMLTKKLPMPVFLSGPHGSDLNFGSERTFGHYNPAFVRWLIDHALAPGKSDALRAAAQATYDARLRVAARAFYAAHLRLKGDPKFFQAEKAKYLRFLDGATESHPRYDYWDGMPGSAEAQAIGGSATGFWLRRSMDGTDVLFVEGLEKLLSQHDADFLAKAQALGFGGFSDGRLHVDEETPPDDIAPEQQDEDYDAVTDEME
ncbi:MAG: hypothetical protein IPK13_24200 [Deltaproteobacteria bacterium]|nr:hypothetical protein [Deltaproteobacteria bacterium]